MRIWLANVDAIFRRELRSYLGAPRFYVAAGVFWLLAGSLFVALLYRLISELAGLDLQTGQMGGGQPVDAAFALQQSFLGILGFLMLLVMPLLSMGLYADERRQGTLELLATSPLANSAVAVGKWAAALAVTLGLILPMGLVEAIALAASDPPITAPGPFLLGYVGLLLLCGAVLALGMFVSSLTRSTLVAALLTLVLLLGLWGVEGLLGSAGGPLADALVQLSLLRQYNRWVLGVFDSSSLVILLSWTLLGLVLTAQSIRALRYRRP